MKTVSSLVLFLALLDNARASHLPHFLGRVNPSTRELTWPGTGVAFSFTGTTASIALNAIHGSNSMELDVDGGKSIIYNVSGTSITAPLKIPYGIHNVTLRKRSDSTWGTITLGNITTDGKFNDPVIHKRHIEILGDSISVGYGLDGNGPCSNNASVENAPKTYGALAATALQAEYSIIAKSSIGLTRNYMNAKPGSNPLLPSLWTQYKAEDSTNSYDFPAAANPQAVVINIGTNDFGYKGVRDPLNPAAYEVGMVTFVKLIAKHYPDAVFFLLTSPMLNDSPPDNQRTTLKGALDTAQKTLIDFRIKVRVVDMPYINDIRGCGGHPTAAEHVSEGKILEQAIREELGW